MPEIDHWLTWKEKCALGLCPSATQSALQAFVHERFRCYAGRYAAAFNVGEAEAASPDARDAWHWFESYFQLRSDRKGKSYKEWLLARVAAKSPMTPGDIESGVSLLLRDVVRDRLRHECSPKRVLSLNTEACRESEGARVSPMDLLPDDFDISDEVERRDIERIAAWLADAVFGKLSFRERVALLGRELGISLANAGFLRLAGCGKSVMAEAHRSALTAVASHVSNEHPDEARATLAALTVAVFHVVKDRTISWARAEKRLSEFLNTVEALNRKGSEGSR